MRPLESFTPNLRLSSSSARSPNCSITARPALTSATGRAGEISSQAAVAHPAKAAQAMPPISVIEQFGKIAELLDNRKARADERHRQGRRNIEPSRGGPPGKGGAGDAADIGYRAVRQDRRTAR